MTEKLVAALSGFPTEEHVKKVCKIEQGEETCRYLTMSPDGWNCAKSGSLRRAIDERIEKGTMNAKGDNCEGILGLIIEKQEELKGKRVEYRESMPSYTSGGDFEGISMKGSTCSIVWRDSEGKEDGQSISVEHLDITVTPRSIVFGISGLGSFAGITTLYLS